MSDKHYTYKNSSCKTVPWGDGLFLYRLCTPPSQRRKGHARELLNRVIAETDQPLYLQPEPWGDRAVSCESLQRFYESLGFKTVTSEQLQSIGIEVDTDSPVMRLAEIELSDTTNHHYHQPHTSSRVAG